MVRMLLKAPGWLQAQRPGLHLPLVPHLPLLVLGCRLRNISPLLLG